MAEYFRNASMMGKKPFKCYNCNKKLITNIEGGDYVIILDCPRCKAEIQITCKEKIPLKNIRDLVKGMG
jgi:phage FluMu protein Com